jgi:hypothetical protein
MLEVLMFLAALVPTVLLGVPLALALSRPGALRPHAARGRHVPRPRVDVARAYVPLDLGPDPVHWPSERAWPSSTSRSPDWPSASWNDEHFGKAGKKALLAIESARPAAELRRAARRPHRGPTTDPLVVVEPAPVPASALVPQVGAAIGLPNVQAPSRDEIEHLIEQLGLAGTVQRIIDRTGWDFRKAAQHLARMRQKS